MVARAFAELRDLITMTVHRPQYEWNVCKTCTDQYVLNQSPWRSWVSPFREDRKRLMELVRGEEEDAEEENGDEEGGGEEDGEWAACTCC